MLLPADLWLDILVHVDPVEYVSIARAFFGVSREFYWLLKNSLTTVRVHHPVGPLSGLVWFRSRDAPVSRCIKCVEGADSPPLFLSHYMQILFMSPLREKPLSFFVFAIRFQNKKRTE